MASPLSGETQLSGDPLTSTDGPRNARGNELQAGHTFPAAKAGAEIVSATPNARVDDSEALMAAMANSRAFPDAPPADLANHARYRIVRQVGVGGMGVVYQAEHRLMERPVALKVISQSLVNDAQAVERFRMEVKAAAKLSHPNIVTAFDAEQAGDLHFLVMEYVDGLSLSRQVELRGPLPLQFACGFIRQAALGLQHAFEKGMVHRDIKPQNLMVTRAGRVKILDFGLARLARDKVEPSGVRSGPNAVDATAGKDKQASPAADPQATLAMLATQAASLYGSAPNSTEGGLTAAGSTIGTPDYIAPEQIANSRAADIRSDIYSLGGTFYFLLTGVPPFPGGSIVDKLIAHHQRTPRAVNELRPDIPPEVAAIVARMLAKEPRDRFQTPAELSHALQPFSRSPASGATTLRAPNGISELPAATASQPPESEAAARPDLPASQGRDATGTANDMRTTRPSLAGPKTGNPKSGGPKTGDPGIGNVLAGNALGGNSPDGGVAMDGRAVNAGVAGTGAPWDAVAGFDFGGPGEPPFDFGALTPALPAAVSPVSTGYPNQVRRRSSRQRLSDWVSQPFDNRTLIWLGGIGATAVASLVLLIAISSWRPFDKEPAKSNASAPIASNGAPAPSENYDAPASSDPAGGDRRWQFPPLRPRPPGARPLGGPGIPVAGGIRRPLRNMQILVVIPHANLYYPDFGNVMRAFEKKSLSSRVAVASSVARPAIPEASFRAEYPEIPVRLTLAEAVPSDYDAVIFTGSNPLHSMEFLANGSAYPVTERFVRAMVREGRCVAGICGGIAVLADTGVVRGQTVAHNPYAFEAVQPGHGIVDWDRSQRVVVHSESRVVTATDAADAMKFVEAVLGQVAQRRAGL